MLTLEELLQIVRQSEEETRAVFGPDATFTLTDYAALIDDVLAGKPLTHGSYTTEERWPF